MDDGLSSFNIAVRAIREIKVRAGEAPRINIDEWRWFAEGPVPPNKLDTAVYGLPREGEKR